MGDGCLVLPIILLLLVLLLILPIVLPIVGVIQARASRRKRADAGRSACPSCGHLLGETALQAAEQRWAEHCLELHQANPGVRFRLIRFVVAICPNCGALLGYRETTRAFGPVESPRGWSDLDGIV